MKTSISDKTLKILVTAVSVFLIVSLSVVLILFFVEKSAGGDLWTNMGLFFIALFVAVPSLALLPFWIMLLTRANKSVHAIAAYVVLLVLLATCMLLGWFYP